jgi:SAM-dependent methyltransferase
MQSGIRTHDKFYLNEDRKLKPKEYFKFVLDNLPYSLNNKRVLDIGCATGDFLHYLLESFPEALLFGLDVDKELIDRAKKEVPSVQEYYELDISSEFSDIGEFDVVFMLAVYAIWDDVSVWIDPILKLMEKSSEARGFVFGSWNPHGLDVFVRIKKHDEEKIELGWNQISKETVGAYLDSKGYKHKFHDFSIGIELEKQDDPLRSWTEKMENGEFLVVNGSQIVHKFALLEIKR